MGNQRGLVGRLACTSILVGLAATAADARHCLGAHLEGGFGSNTARPLVEESSSSVTACAGLSTSLLRTFRLGLEVSATASTGNGGIRFPESPRPGDRSLTTFLVGVEATQRRAGPFAFLGAGVGRSTLKHALGTFVPPYGDNWVIPSRGLTAFAFGAGAGYRFRGGPGPLGFQLALRAHALADAGRIPSSAFAFTIGLAY